MSYFVYILCMPSIGWRDYVINSCIVCCVHCIFLCLSYVFFFVDNFRVDLYCVMHVHENNAREMVVVI